MSTEQVTPENIHAYLKQHQEKELCRFVTVGSVDDGKSTLIGRLLHDTHGIYEDQLAAVKKATKQEGEEIDFSLFTDGLKAEREQGITIDVAYRYFSTENRKFIIADTPGHVQYTRNMATGASTANVAVILIDARLGVLQQSRRHAYIASLLGIPHLAVCVNKMDLKDYDQSVFEAIKAEFTAFCAQLRFHEVKFIPISAKLGVNIVHESEKTPWYTGGTILQYLEQVPVRAGINETDFRYPVQYVLRPHLNYRGFSGTIASGRVKKGDTLMSLPSGKSSKVVAIDTFDGEFEEASAPMAITIRLADEIDTSRGDMLVHPDNVPLQLQRFRAKLVWLNEEALDRSKTYMVKHTTQMVRADVESVEFLVDLETLEKKPSNRIELNDIGEVIINAHRKLFVDPYQNNGATGSFILIDPITNNTVAAGMVEGPADDSAQAGKRHVHEKLNYVEFASRDLIATKRFFKDCFGWAFHDFGDDYSSFANEGLEGGFYKADKASRADGGGALLVFYSENLEKTLAKVQAMGGTLVRPIYAFPGGRRFHFTEPSGNEFAVWGE